MSISSILNIAKNALLATQYSIQITANNISNVNTEGYSRQAPVLEPEASSRIGNAILGNGVYIKGVIRYTDRYLERQLSEKNTELEENKVYHTYYERIEAILNEDNSKLSESITEFFNNWHELSSDPYSVSLREGIKASGENLCRVIRNIYNSLFQLQIELDEKLKVEIEDINRITREIADLNRRIFESSSGTTGDNDLMDKRQTLIRELSGKLKVTYFEDDFGMITVLTKSGNLLVDGGKSYNLSPIDTGTNGFSGVAWVDPLGKLVNITDTLEGGELRALIKMRDKVIPEFISDLDSLAEALIREVNNVHVKGYTLFGTQNVFFFKNIQTYFAKDIDLSDEVKSSIRNIVASEGLADTGVPLGNNIALTIALVSNQKIQFQNKVTGNILNCTITDFISSLNSKIGQLAKNASQVKEFSEATYSIMEKQRESISGVSIDEEVANLIKYQYAYQAASRLFNIADELFKSLIEAVR
ncbi:MAG: flagellar hook-associated protein FlgK [Deltaproteobacteria bacterium]|nr:flagellar hook-associated protein FlgK [Deltaproteobacteria bacterium]